MPVVTFPLGTLCRLLGKSLSSEEIVQLLGELGCDVEGYDQLTGGVKLNLLPARPDMFDLCGLVRCLRGYLKIETGIKSYSFNPSGVTIRVEKGVENVRRFIVGAVVKNVRLDAELVTMLMELQENLHWGLGRNRRRASIGIYDLEKVRPDFVYRAVEPGGVRFVPLGGVAGVELTSLTPAEILKSHPKGIAYRHLLKDSAVYPLLTDNTGRVLSLPPIINSEDTKVTENSRALLVDVTGPDEWAINKCLAVVGAAFADLGGEVQTVRVVYPDGRVEVTPDMTPEQMRINLEDAAAVIGISLSVDEASELLQLMRYGVAKVEKDQKTVEVLIPAYRADVLHAWDIFEDIAIAYGYHRLPQRLIQTVTTSVPLAMEEVSQLCRRILTGLGFIETTTLALTSPEAHFHKLNLSDDGMTVQLENPASVEQTILRRHLLSGLLETFEINLTRSLPQQIFEVNDVFQVQEGEETKAAVRRHLAFGIADAKAGFAEIKAVLEALVRELDFAVSFHSNDTAPFLSGRGAAIVAGGERIGVMGEVHPEILERFGLTVPVVLAEIDISWLKTSSGR
ncbi:MAG: phenylalanine--tRNA ligase subunit beta [bacterium]